MLLMVVVVNGTVVRLKVCLREKELEEINGRWVRIEKRGVSLAIETVPRSIVNDDVVVVFKIKTLSIDR